MIDWNEYADDVDFYDGIVDANPCTDTYAQRWRARIAHPSWDQKRHDFLWYTDGHCDRCPPGTSRIHPSQLQLHHKHYDTLWYENNNDLELLCPHHHRDADRERAEQAEMLNEWTLEERARAYMEIANRWSGQDDWPVSYKEALEKVSE